MRILIILLGITLLAGCTKYVNEPTERVESNEESTASESTVSQEATLITEPTVTTLPAPTFGTQTKSAHFVSSSPAHGDILSKPPAVIEFTFNFDIDPSSTVSVTANGVEYAQGEPQVGSDRLTLTQVLAPLEDGDYLVKYSACWPDNTCHPGQFEFAVWID